ncbi:VTT domain-containing protein [Methanohalophilus sp.]
MGINNTYLAIFMLSLIGGVSTFTSTTFYTVLITIALSEVNPVWLGLIASLGLTLGDLLFYYMGRKGKQCVPGKYEAKVIKLTAKMEKINDKLIVLIIFLYSLTPLPSDILAIGLAFGGFSVKKLIPPLFLGNFVLILLLVEFSRLGYGIL